MGQLGADGGDRKEIPLYKDHREPAMTNEEMKSRAEQTLYKIISEILEVGDADVWLIAGGKAKKTILFERGKKIREVLGITETAIIKERHDGDITHVDFSMRLENGFFRHIRNPLTLNYCAEFTGHRAIKFSEFHLTIDDFTEEELDKVDKTKMEYEKVVMWCKTTGKWGDDREYFYETLRNWKFT